MNLTKSYRNGDVCVTALSDASLTVDKGEYLAVTGPSGSGKSTFLNLIGCLDVADSGTYFLCGNDVFALSNDELSNLRAKTIGFVFQSFHLMCQLNALENVELPLLYQGMEIKKRKKLALRALEQVGLASRKHHRPNELSGGQQQRVAIARAIVTNPPLILADEPTGNLDSDSGEIILGLLDKINEQGATIVLITHDPSVAGRAKRRVEVRDGIVRPVV